MYYMIKNGNQVLHTGTAEPNTVGTRYELLWFDTEAEMLQYIEDNHLEIVEVEDNCGISNNYRKCKELPI